MNESLNKIKLRLRIPARKKVVKILIYTIILSLSALVVPNLIIVSSTRHLIQKDYSMIEKADVGIILGASVYSDKRVSPVVNDRIESAVLLYKNKKVGRLLISGDHAERYYNEVDTIKFWLLKNDIPLSDIYIDPSGFSTYESVYRAKKVFNVQNAVIITQSFHLPRALYLARYWKISAQGFVADQRIYKHARYFLFREYLARVKDFFYIYVLNQE